MNWYLVVRVPYSWDLPAPLVVLGVFLYRDEAETFAEQQEDEVMILEGRRP